MILGTDNHNNKVQEKKLQLPIEPEEESAKNNIENIDGRKNFLPILILSTGIKG